MKRIDWFLIGVLVLVVGIFFYPTLRYGKLPTPTDALVGLYHPWRDLLADRYPRGVPFKNFLITDPVRQQIPWRKVAIEQWKQGKVPWWNPYTFSGTPLAGNIQAAVFYPLNILFFLLPFPVAWVLLIILQPVLAGIFLYIFLRHLKLHPLAATVGAISWSFSGFMIAWLTWGTIGHVVLWLPLILLSIDKLAVGRNSISLHSNSVWWGLLVGALVLEFLAGHAQLSFYVITFAAAYAFFRIRSLERKKVRFLLKMLGWAGAAFVALTSVQWVPLWGLLAHSSRVMEETLWQKRGFFLPWQHLVQFVAPDFFGNPATMNYWGEWNYGEFIGYIGMVPLLLALIATLSDWGRSKFWVVVGGMALLLALPTPLAKLPYFFKLPLLASLQPTRFISLVDFSLAVLAALGADTILKGRRNKWRGPLFLVGGGLVGLWLVSWAIPQSSLEPAVIQNFFVARRNLVLPTVLFGAGSFFLWLSIKVRSIRTAALFTLVIITVFDLIRFGWKFTPFTPREYFFPETKVISFLQSQPKPFRVMSLDDRILPPNVASYFGIETIEGYDPIYLARYEQFLAVVARGKPDITPPYGFNRILTLKNIDSPLLPLLNVGYVLTLSDLDRPFLQKVFQEGETRVYEYLSSLSRMYLAEHVVAAEADEAELVALFDKRKELAAVGPRGLDILSLPLSTDESVEIVRYSPSELVLNVHVRNKRLLVVGNVFAPGWTARIDGGKVPLIRVNYTFQSVVVPTGSHQVTLRAGPSLLLPSEL